MASDSRKATPSSTGMRDSVRTSELLKVLVLVVLYMLVLELVLLVLVLVCWWVVHRVPQYRAEYSVPARTEKMIKAIEERDFQAFAETTIRDSNQFHAICQDTFPPCVYLTATSHLVSALIHQLNAHFGESVACYTFDAGPNACIFLTEKYVGLVAGLLRHFLADPAEGEFLRGEAVEVEEEVVGKLAGVLAVPRVAGGLKYVIHTSPGEGPEVLQVGATDWPRATLIRFGKT